jgi:hypothetical protein
MEPGTPGTGVPSKHGCVFNQVRWNRAGWFDAEVLILPPSQTVRLSTLLRALDRAAFFGARNSEAVRAGDMGKGSSAYLIGQSPALPRP